MSKKQNDNIVLGVMFLGMIWWLFSGQELITKNSDYINFVSKYKNGSFFSIKTIIDLSVILYPTYLWMNICMGGGSFKDNIILLLSPLFVLVMVAFFGTVIAISSILRFLAPVFLGLIILYYVITKFYDFFIKKKKSTKKIKNYNKAPVKSDPQILKPKYSSNEKPYMFDYRGYEVRHNNLCYWVEGIKFNSSDEAKNYIDSL